MDGYLGDTFAKIADYTVVLTKQFIPIVNERWGVPLENIRYMPHGRQKMYALSENTLSRYDEKKYNFLFFGYMREYKGLRVLAKAFEKLSKVRGDVTLTLAGSGDFSKYQADFAGLNGVTVDNRYIQDDEVGSYFYGENVITVMPYLDATQSGVSLTAMEYGSVIIASDTGGLKAQLNEGEIGAYCKAGDVESLFEQMLYVIEHPQFVEEQKQKMQAYLAEIEWDNVVKRLMQTI
jgi:glycosyltransferase involved in cell wall biosynthesis